MTGIQLFREVELPLATPLMLTGLRLALVQVWATATIAALVAGPGLGDVITLGFLRSDYGQALGCLAGVDVAGGGFDAVVHLAGIPTPGAAPDAEIFTRNTLSTYNVFHACRALGVKRIVWASSETLLGLPFREPPQ